MLNHICHTCYKPIGDVNITPGCCKCYHPCKDGVTYLPCVIYGLHDSESDSDLTCLGIPRGTSLFTTILQIYRKILNRVRVQDSNSMDLKYECGILSMDVRIDPASTLPYSIGPAGLKLDCCQFNCDSIQYSFDFEITEVDRLSDFYSRSEPYHFSLSDYLTGIHFTDNSTITGDVLQWITYTDLLDNGSYTFYNTGDSFIMPTGVCARSLLGLTKQFVFEAFTQKGCHVKQICDFGIERVPYTERFTQPYRQNFQISDVPIVQDLNTPVGIDHGILYFSDTAPVNINNGSSFGGAIRKINLNTRETYTISGKLSNSLNPVTTNNAWGDDNGYNFPSSICIDKDEIYNNEPVLYFCIFRNGGNGTGGMVIRLVKEADGNCDDRRNWKTYVIAGTGALGDVPNAIGVDTPGDQAIFGALYGCKKWLDINGMPSFYVMDSSVGHIKLVYYSGTGNVNQASSWRVRKVSLNGTTAYTVSGVAVNLNVDKIGVNTYRLIVLDGAAIRFHDFTGTATPANATNLSTWVNTVVVNNGVGTIDGLNTGGAKVNGPSHIFKYNYLGDDYYVFGQEVLGAGVQNTVVRTIKETSPGVFDFNTICSDPSVGPLGTSGSYANPGSVNGLSQGFFTDLQGVLRDFTLGGIRTWDWGASACSVLAGGAFAGDTQVEYSNLVTPVRIDTEYRHVLDCDTNPCDIPQVTVGQITSTSLIVTITNYNPNFSYDLSIDGGNTFPIQGITNPFTLTGLSPNTQYLISVRVHCDIGVSQVGNTIVVTTPPTTVECPPFYFTVTSVTQNGFAISILNPQLGDLYSVSIDGGVTYVIVNTLNTSIFVSGLLPSQSYSIVVKKETSTGQICYSGPYNIQTLGRDTYCIEVIKTPHPTIFGAYLVTATLKNQIGVAVNATSNLTVSVLLYDPATLTTTPLVLTISAGTSSVTSIPIMTSTNSLVCYDPSVWFGCDPADITNPCPCNMQPCPCGTCVVFTDLGSGNLQFTHHDCNGNPLMTLVDIVIDFECSGNPYSITLPQGLTQITGNFPGCNIANWTLVSITPSSIGICHE